MARIGENADPRTHSEDAEEAVVYILVARAKKLILVGLKALLLIWYWIRLPIYAARNGLIIQRRGVKPVISTPFEGVFNGRQEMYRTFEALVALLEDEKIDFFVVPKADGEYALGVMSEHCSKTVELLNKKLKFKGYYYQLIKHRYNTNLTRLLDFGVPTRNIGNIAAVAIYRNIGGHNNRMVPGNPYKVSVEFWTKAKHLPPDLRKLAMSIAGIMDESALEDSIVAPTYNGIAKVFSTKAQTTSTIKVNNREYPTLKIFKEQLLNKVQFPIDVVYTWVDSTDPKWLKAYEAARKKVNPDYKNNSMARYTDHDELKYSLRSVEMYAPWVRNIYIVTAGQRPHWLKPGVDERVQIIDHKDIFSDPSALPVFNSHAIESQLHHIPGLSEHYLYLNDDMIFANPTTPETFFHPNGIAKIQPSTATIGTGDPTIHETAPSSAGKNARDIIKKTFGVYATNKYRHTVLPQIKSVAQEIENKHTDTVRATMFSKFRSPANVPFAGSLMQGYLLASGAGVAQLLPTATVDVSKRNSVHVMKGLLKHQPYITICLNETTTSPAEAALVSERVGRFLENFLPYPSSWEKEHDK